MLEIVNYSLLYGQRKLPECLCYMGDHRAQDTFIGWYAKALEYYTRQDIGGVALAGHRGSDSSRT